MDDYLDLVQLDPSYRIHYSDGTTLDVTSRINAMLDGVERIEPACGTEIPRLPVRDRTALPARARRVRGPQRPPAAGFLQLRGTAVLLVRARAMERLQRMVSRYFRSEKLRHRFSFQSLYWVSSPFDSPAIYSLLPYTEIAGGLYFPRGGMHAIPRALARLAEELGVVFRYRCRSDPPGARQAVECRRPAGGWHTPAGPTSSWPMPTFRTCTRRLLGERYPRIEHMDFSCSAFLMYLGVGRTYPQLTHHALIVPRDLRAACEDIFDHHRTPADPPYYLCNPSKTDSTLAPQRLARTCTSSCRCPASRRAARSIGRSRVHASRPPPWSDSSASGCAISGATSSPAAPSPQTTSPAASRPPEARRSAWPTASTRSAGSARTTGTQPTSNLYFVGQSTHPGCGVPMVLISARLVAERIAEEQAVRS